MLTIEDFTRHRPQTVGTVAHLVIGRLAAKTRSPRVDEITTAVSKALPQFRADEALSHRQSVASAVNTYFVHLLPPVRFQWAGAEVRLDTGRVDLVWRDGQDVILDELKTGSAPLGTRERQQAGAYAALAWETLHGRFLGVRLVSTYRPSSSLLVTHDAPSRPLSDTGLVAPRSR